MGVFSGDFYSRALRRNTRLGIIFPEESEDVTLEYPGSPKVLYLLHGLGGNSDEWVRFTKIEYYAKKYNFIVIMPEVDRSFYCDQTAGSRYFSYIADDLPGICHSWFRLDTRRENTFIAGESMGGYGAVKIGLRRPSRFGAIASLSGVLDYPALIRQVVRGEWTDMEPGEFHFLHGTTKVAGTEDDVIALVRQAASDPNRPRLLQLCGTEDFLYENNQRFRSAAEEAGYGHVYMEAPGEHAWPYWDRAIQQAIRFFLGLNLLDMIYY